MITRDAQLKLQAYLDGELPAADAAEVQALLACDAEAQLLRDELQATKSVLTGGETACRLPESREFFWSKIQREIERQESRAPELEKISWLEWLQRHLLPVSGVALVACLAGIFVLSLGGSSGQLGEMELASDDMGSYTFRDQEQGTTMVWLYNRNADSTSAEPASASEEVLQ